MVPGTVTIRKTEIILGILSKGYLNRELVNGYLKVMEQKRKVKGLLKDTGAPWLCEVTGLKGACRGEIKGER